MSLRRFFLRCQRTLKRTLFGKSVQHLSRRDCNKPAYSSRQPQHNKLEYRQRWSKCRPVNFRALPNWATILESRIEQWTPLEWSGWREWAAAYRVWNWKERWVKSFGWIKVLSIFYLVFLIHNKAAILATTDSQRIWLK